MNVDTRIAALLSIVVWSNGIAADAALRVDGASEMTTRDSIRLIVRNLTDDERQRFEAAIAEIRIGNPKGAYDGLKGPDVLSDDELLGKRISGMNYYDILSFSDNSRRKN